MASSKYITSDGNYWDKYITNEAIVKRFSEDYFDACVLHASKIIYNILRKSDGIFIDYVYDNLLCKYPSDDKMYNDLFNKSFKYLLFNTLFFNKDLEKGNKTLYLNKSISSKRFEYLEKIFKDDNLNDFSIKDKKCESCYILSIISNLFSIDLVFKDNNIIVDYLAEIKLVEGDSNENSKG